MWGVKMNNWITEQMLAWAKNPENIKAFRESCQEIFNDFATENNAKVIIPSWSATATIKEIVDNWIINEDARIIRKGSAYFIENSQTGFCKNLGKYKTFVIEYALMAGRRYDEELLSFSHDGQMI